MSLITACPACQTQFEVTDEQLQAYAGKVRCGECDHVFDARSHLVSSDAMLATEEHAHLGAPAASEAAVYFNVSAEAAQTHPVPDVLLEESMPPDLSIQPDAQVEPDIPAFLRDVSLEDERPQTRATSSSPWLYGLFSAILLLVLGLQTLYFSRTTLAASYPQTKPILQTLCKPLHCVLGLPQEITQLTIDDADIQEHKTREGVLVFSSVLMNHGEVVQAYPMIELTLTNTADEPILRKTLKPQDYLPKTVDASNGLAALQEQSAKVLLGVDEKLVTGFRVAIAY